ncbi:MAG: hypothetical protein WC379_17720 [Methanoregula sp.]|jgi:hypothetical protein
MNEKEISERIDLLLNSTSQGKTLERFEKALNKEDVRNIIIELIKRDELHLTT